MVVIVGLVITVGWIISGLVYGALPPEDYTSPWREFIYMISLAGLILICARENKWGFLSAIVLGIVIFGAEVYLAPIKISQGQIGGMIWGIIQIPIIIFAYRAYRAV